MAGNTTQYTGIRDVPNLVHKTEFRTFMGNPDAKLSRVVVDVLWRIFIAIGTWGTRLIVELIKCNKFITYTRQIANKLCVRSGSDISEDASNDKSDNNGVTMGPVPEIKIA